MASLDYIFYKEFNKTMAERRTQADLDIFKIALPESFKNLAQNRANHLVHIQKIQDEYYSKLNGTTGVILYRTKSKLFKRKFDYLGEFMKKDDKFIYEEVTIPQTCIAVLSDIKIGIPTSHKPSEELSYVDYVEKGNQRKYIYIIPKIYCFEIDRVALVLSINRQRALYEGVSIYLGNGYKVYLSIIPYKPSKRDDIINYRLIAIKADKDFKQIFTELQQFWVAQGIIFNPELTKLSETISNTTNASFNNIPSSTDRHSGIRIDSLAISSNNEDIEFDE